MKKILLFWALVSFFLCVSHAVDAGSTVRYDYKQKQGSETYDVHLYLEETDCCWRFTCDSPDEKSVSLNDDSFYTLEWSMTNRDDESDIKVVRINDRLVITGRYKGKSIDKSVVIDHAPWHQATSLSLRGFALSDEQERFFWFLRSDCLSAVRFKAVKESVEQIQIEGRSFRAQRIVIRPAGIKSVFWKGVYWFRENDGVMLKFQGSASLPGVGASEITFVGYKESID